MKRIILCASIFLAACSKKEQKFSMANFPCLNAPIFIISATYVSPTKEEQAKRQFETYMETFKGAQDRKEYVRCLEKKPGSQDYRDNYAKAQKDSKDLGNELQTRMSVYPPQKQIVRVVDETIYENQKPLQYRTVAFLRDGTQTISE